jgi:phage FluMu gp28-like protein
LKLLPYQKEIINNNHRLLQVVKSRQIGLSFAFAYRALRNCLKYNTEQIILSASFRQSLRVMGYIELLLTVMPRELKLITDKQQEKKFAFNNKSIYCLPQNSLTITGFSGDIFLDEFALYKKPDLIYTAAFPTITRGYSLLLCSTPLGKNNLFYEIYTNRDKYKDFNRKVITIYDAIRQGLKIDLDLLKNNIDNVSFEQEYNCSFEEDKDSYFSLSELNECLIDYEFNSKPIKYYIGIDIGRKHDKTAITILSEEKNFFYITDIITLDNVNFSQQKSVIEKLINQYEPHKVIIDKTGIGMQLCEELENRFGFVQGIIMNNKIKNDIITFGKKIIETKKLKFDNEKIIYELLSIRKKFLNSTIIYSANRNTEGHSDIAFSILYSIYAVKQEELTEIKIAFV